MSYYVWGSGISYAQYLQAKSFVDDVSSTSRRVSLELSRQTRELIASNESLARQNIQIINATADGFDRLSYSLEAIETELAELNATFHWGFSQVISQLGHMNDSLAQLVKIAKTPVQTTAYNHFEIARDAFRQRLYKECLEELNKAVYGDHTSPGYKLEWRFHQMLGTLRLGFVGGDLSLVDLNQAQETFLLSARYARSDYPDDAARAFLSAGWAAYCQGKLDEALEYTENAIKLNSVVRIAGAVRQLGLKYTSSFSEGFFQAAKILMAKGYVERSLEMLREAVLCDHRYILKAAGDGDFQKHTRELQDFINRLRLEAKPEGEAAIASAQSVIEEMEEWHANEAASTQYEAALFLLNDARRSFQTASYFGYLDAKKLSREAIDAAKKAVEIQKNYMEQSINTMKERVESFWKDNRDYMYSAAHNYVETALTEGGDFAKYKSQMNAPSEVASVQKHWRDALKYSAIKSYDSYQQAQTHLRVCLKLGLDAVERSIGSLESKTLGSMNTAFVLACLWPLVLPTFISFQIWDWERVIPLKIQDQNIEVGGIIFWVLAGLIFLPITIIIAFVIFCVILSSYNKNKSTIRKNYEDLRMSLRAKYSYHA